MAFKFGDQGDRPDEMHEINVTPFIDVMLVLLIIFMVAAPLSTVDVKVDLPTSTAPPQARPDKPLFVTITADRGVSVGDIATSLENLAGALARATGGDKNARIFLRADQTVPYGGLMQVMNAFRAAGYLKVALVGLEGPAQP
jgi:biopolymer transport protein ExbD